MVGSGTTKIATKKSYTVYTEAGVLKYNLEKSQNHKSKHSSIDILDALSGVEPVLFVANYSPLPVSDGAQCWARASLQPWLRYWAVNTSWSQPVSLCALGTGHTGLVLDTLPREPLAGQASLHADYHLIHLMNGPSLQNMTQSWLHTEFSLKFHRNIMNAILFQD